MILMQRLWENQLSIFTPNKDEVQIYRSNKRKIYNYIEENKTYYLNKCMALIIQK